MQYLKVNKKHIQNNSIIAKRADENNFRFINNRQFGEDLTLSLKNGNRAVNHKLSIKNKNQEQNKVNNIIFNFVFCRLKFI
jgi:serine/threonine protein phosphatase PrpC